MVVIFIPIRDERSKFNIHQTTWDVYLIVFGPYSHLRLNVF
jgi:hypothetical protein